MDEVIKAKQRQQMAGSSLRAISIHGARVHTGGTAWGKTQAVFPRNRRIPLIAGGAAALIVAVVVVMAASHKSTPEAATPNPEAVTVTAPVTATATATASSRDRPLCAR